MAYYQKSNTLCSPIFIILIFSLACSWISPAVENARILAVETEYAQSHWNFMSFVLRELSNTGHHVTVFTPFPDGGNRDNYTEVDTSKEFPSVLEMDLVETLSLWRKPTAMVKNAIKSARQFCDILYDNAQMKKIMENHKNHMFDLVIIETHGVNCVSYLATKLNLPMIYIIPSPMITYAERFFHGHIPNPATISSLCYGHAFPKTFYQRLENTVLSVYSLLFINFDEWIIKFINQKPHHSITRYYQPSLIFVNSHYITEASRPFPPSVVQIGGIHLKPVKNMSKDILEFIENSPHGVVLFAFGATIKISAIPEDTMKKLKKALAQVPQRILMKYEGEMKNKPKNVMTAKWLPQRDILMHPNTKLFISHGGISSIYETVDAGVPVLGFPLFYDQPKNIDNLVNAGMAISMDIESVREDAFLRNVLELVNNPKYAKNAKITSERFKDRPMSPEKSVAYWTDYVVRHKGAPHLKSHATNLTWYQYLLLDVISVVIVFVVIILFILYTVLKNIHSYILKYKTKAKRE
ncbi:UDP-glucuronosyl/UDP-glucosyltransferase [Cinara cedri]|uniref:UDP-glucuronosyltransferase n=1 Tax=Cinara cedri TaxID=506608 RepID=A0A5E4MS01_9HEMI|nr:UDP-glucuronosyl/UDP-glucosyltransferase [Cinara cedri]